jgi:hypothetical protein
MLYFQVLFYTGFLFLLCYHYSQLIPDIYRTRHHLKNTQLENLKCYVLMHSSYTDRTYSLSRLFQNKVL